LVPLLAAGLLVSGMATKANADTITVSGSIPSFDTDDFATASLPFFESAPGFVAGDVLTGVKLEIDATETITLLQLTNSAKPPAHPHKFTFTATGTVDYSVSSAPGFSILPITLDTFPMQTVILAAGATFQPIPPFKSTDFNSGLVSVAFSPYDTTGTFDLGFATSNFTTIGGGGHETNTVTTEASGTVEAIYTFTPPTGRVPEPGTIFLLGSGLLFAGSLLRKRYRRG